MNEMPEYGIWADMIQRCTNPRRRAYRYYGGRGITIDARWRESFETFLADVGPRPTPEHSIDRYPNNDGPYAPGNVRWATRHEQARNRRSNVLLTHEGQTRTMAEWAHAIGVNEDTIQARLKKGWSHARALTESVRLSPNTPLVYRGERRTAAEWAIVLGMTANCLRARLRAGWPVERALTEPLRS